MENSDELNIVLYQPWSVPVAKLQLPPWVLGKMIEITDKIIEDVNSVSHGQYLAGQIEKELVVDHKLLQEAQIYNFFLQVMGRYISHCRTNCGRSEKVEMQMASMWTVSQFPDEYNPIHYHTQCQMSAVMYLKVPNMEIARKAHKPNEDGSITFIHNASRDIMLSEPSFSTRPVVGDMYIFGGQTLHTVYPFRCSEGDPERRSVSFNTIIRESSEVGRAEHDNITAWNMKLLGKENNSEENGS